jgi:hypothetical protein
MLSLSLGGVGKLISAPRPKVTAAARQVHLQSRQKFLNRSGLSSVYRSVCWSLGAGRRQPG